MPNNLIEKRFEKLAPKLIEALESRNFEAYYCDNEKDALDKALSLIPEDAVVSWGGSETVVQLGLIEAVKNRGNEVIDRDTAKNPGERAEIMRKSFFCDVYLTSTNAMSIDGQLVNVDGIGNRVAAQSYGPKTVLYIVGMNKVCQTLEDAEARARTYAAPINAARFGLQNTVCAVSGACGNCKSNECICSFIVTTRMNKIPGRVKIILVGKNMGF